MSYTIPSDANVPGNSGHTTDHNNIADMLSLLTGVSSGNTLTSAQQTAVTDGAVLVAPQLALAPSGATGETFTRTMGTTYLSSLTSEQVYVSAIPLPVGLTVNNISLQLGNAQFTVVDVTHGWYALLDSSRIVRAVSADQTSGNWGPGSANSPVTLSVSASNYATTYAGLYYIALCITFTGSSGEFVAGPASIGGVGGVAPILSGTSSASQTSPPVTGTTMGSITNVPADRFYAYTS
jgi:hypothetical protein